jgi:hypothetical protein
MSLLELFCAVDDFMLSFEPHQLKNISHNKCAVSCHRGIERT